MNANLTFGQVLQSLPDFLDKEHLVSPFSSRNHPSDTLNTKQRVQTVALSAILALGVLFTGSFSTTAIAIGAPLFIAAIYLIAAIFKISNNYRPDSPIDLEDPYSGYASDDDDVEVFSGDRVHESCGGGGGSINRHWRLEYL